MPGNPVAYFALKPIMPYHKSDIALLVAYHITKIIVKAENPMITPPINRTIA